jgi:hypothetical protein
MIASAGQGVLLVERDRTSSVVTKPCSFPYSGVSWRRAKASARESNAKSTLGAAWNEAVTRNKEVAHPSRIQQASSIYP